ncbi:hypothetical protein ILFOPFJJ_06492 [Ensifer psoraleae]|uniref:nodulation protein NopA n=1 Tax=Sinorhizobium psoraleae TaxID=520838 RepID=UPI0015691A2E|nr:nodulation protein NopA [Sinorhizobium psoraleae]NRP75569.1 hypothetical protein [Sinorhizobium psoraleae]
MGKQVGSSGNTGGTNPNMGANANAKNDGAAAFKAQIEELAAVSAEATNRSMLLRTVTTQLTTVKKVADERVQ